MWRGVDQDPEVEGVADARDDDVDGVGGTECPRERPEAGVTGQERADRLEEGVIGITAILLLGVANKEGNLRERRTSEQAL